MRLQELFSGIAFTALCVGTATPSVSAQSVRSIPFPAELSGSFAGASGLWVRPDEAALRELCALDRVVLKDTPLADGSRVDLELSRTRFDDAELVVVLDGAPQGKGFRDASLSMWRGRIAEDETSDVFLALSMYGSRGWVRTERGLFHLLAGPGEGGDWSRSISRWVSDAELAAAGATLGNFCAGAKVPPHSLGAATRKRDTLAATTTANCRMAITTDFQLFQVFANVTAEQTYVTQLFTAASSLYNAEVDTALTLVQLQLYSNANDPWNDADDAGTRLGALQAAWQGNIPNGGNLGHLLSGGNLGGGVAWLDVLCNSDYGFGVSGNLGGDSPFPVVQGPLTWDFMVFTHEVGHNFGSPHTHDLCPPADRCAPAGYFGQCQTQQVCTNSGTIMSYCHLCSGGMSNVALTFHPQCRVLMTQSVQSSCLGPFLPGSAYCFGDGTLWTPCPCAPPNTVPNPSGAHDAGCANSFNLAGAQLLAAGDINPDGVVLMGEGLPPVSFTFFVMGSATSEDGIANGDGVRCVDGALIRFGAQNAVSGTTTYPNVGLGLTQPLSLVSGTQSGSGVTRQYQIFYRNTAPNFCSAGTTNWSSAYRIVWF